MEDSFTASQRSKWERLAETFFDSSPPAIPSSDDLANFKRAIGAARRTAVLGCTPSLRRLARELGDNHVVVDFSVAVYHVSQRYMPIGWEDTFVCADWVQLPLRSESLNAVVGDKSLDNVDPSRWDSFFKEMSRVLADDGALVLHVGLSDPSFEVVDPQGALVKWSRRLADGSCTLTEAAAGLWDDLLTSSSSRSEEAVLSVGLWEEELSEIARLRDEGRLDEMQVELLREFEGTFAGFLDHAWTDCSLPLIDTRSRPYFTIEDIAFSKDYDIAPSQPIIRLRRR